MKQILFLTCTFLVVLAQALGAAPGDNNAADIIRKADIAEGYRSAYSEYEQVITTTSGAKRTLGVRAWARENGDRQLAEYLTTADIKGQKILMTDDGDNIWMFNAETRRTRKLGSHMKKKKIMGSDFTYEDQAGGTLSEKYTGLVVGQEPQDGHDCFVLDLIPTPEGPSYDKIRTWISASDFVTRRVDYFQNGENAPFKRMTATDIRRVPCPASEGAETKTVPFTVVMTNLEDRTETVNQLKRILFGAEIPETVFSPRTLNR